MTRRSLFGVTAAGAFVAPTLAQPKIGPPPHQKGPKVFLDYDQVELDAAYTQAAYAPNMQQVRQRYASNSELVRARLGEPMRIAYGPTEIERLDIYRARATKAPVNILIHGGAWRGDLAADYAFPGELFVSAGAHYVVPDFVWVQNAAAV